LRTLPALTALKAEDSDEQHGINIIIRAIEEPLRQIANNAGHEGSIVVEKVKAASGSMGFNAATGVYEDLMAAGIIDPTKVTRIALQNAASVSGLLLTTEAMIAELPKKEEKSPMPSGGGMGDMY